MSYHLINIVQQLGQPRILVLGDLILDRYTWGNAERISQEAPVILLREDCQEARLGGAANVAHMLRGLETPVTMAGVVGADQDGDQIRQALQSAGIDDSAVIRDDCRPTTVKERFIGRAQHRHPHQMLRVDRESRTPLSPAITERLINHLLPLIPKHQAVLISDYAKGTCTGPLLAQLIDACRQAGVPVIVDPATQADYDQYRGVTAITPNRLETSRATGKEIRTAEDAIAAGRQLCAKLNLDYAFITLDSDGIALVMADGAAQMVATRRREVYDITGAGDMVLAMVGLGVAAGVPPLDLARLANVAGGLEVEQIGVVTIGREQILGDLLSGARQIDEKVCSLEVLSRHVNARRKLGQRIVLTNGCFDMLHVGHVASLQQAAHEGDCLIVAVNSDQSVRQLGKGPERPIFGQTHRATMLAALEAVDYVTIFDEVTPHQVIERLKPDLLVKGGTYRHDEIVGWELVESYGGQVKALGVIPGISTTEILNRLNSAQTGPTLPFTPRLPERKAG